MACRPNRIFHLTVSQRHDIVELEREIDAAIRNIDEPHLTIFINKSEKVIDEVCKLYANHWNIVQTKHSTGMTELEFTA